MNNIKLPKTLKKLSLYARSKGNAANIEWRVLGNPDSWHDLAPDLVRFDWVHDVRTVTQIGLQVLSRTDHDSAVIIERIELDGEPLSDLDHFGIYQLRSGGIKLCLQQRAQGLSAVLSVGRSGGSSSGGCGALVKG